MSDFVQPQKVNPSPLSSEHESSESLGGISQTPPAFQLMASGENVAQLQAPIQRQQTATSTVVGYIHGEMTTNVSSSNANYIRNNLTLGRLMPAPGNLIFMFNAYKRWFDMVKPGGPWDHKAHISSTYGQWSQDTVSNKEYFFDIWSNVHYGYVGKACGFSDWDLLNGAGAAQVMAGTVPEGYWRRRFERLGDADVLAAFDDPKDQAAIRLGISLWGNHGTGVTSAQILAAARGMAGSLSTR